MVWFSVDDGIWSHPKFIRLPDSAQALWLRAGSWAAKNLTDGFVPQNALSTLGYRKRTVQYLIDAGLWEVVDKGFQFHDWTRYQRSREQVEADRVANVERQRRARSRRYAATDVRSSGAQVETEWRSSGDSLAKVWPKNGDENPVESTIEGDRNAVSHAAPTLPYPSLPTDTPKGVSRVAGSNRLKGAFAEAWSHWPKHDRQLEAEGQFVRIVNHFNGDTQEAARVVALHGDAYASSGRAVTHIPTLSRWLEGERWNDPLVQPEGVQRAGQRVNPARQRMDEADAVIERMRELERQQEHNTPRKAVEG